MEQFIGCDAHQKYSVFVTMDDKGRASQPVRVENNKAELRRYLAGPPKARPGGRGGQRKLVLVGGRTGGGGLEPRLVEARQARQRMGARKKTDAVDALGLAMLLRNGTLPTIWIPNFNLRDLRGLLRTRLAMRRQATFLKNRLTAAIRRYGLREDQCSDLFAGRRAGVSC